MDFFHALLTNSTDQLEDLNNVNDLNEYGWSPLMLASRIGDAKSVDVILSKNGVDVNVRDNYGWTALIAATLNGYHEIVKRLVSRKEIDINAQNMYGCTSLYIASKLGYMSIVQTLLTHQDINVNIQSKKQNLSPLHVASLCGFHQIVHAISNSNFCHLNARDSGGWTALSIACSKGFDIVVQILVASPETDVNMPNNKGFTPLIIGMI